MNGVTHRRRRLRPRPDEHGEPLGRIAETAADVEHAVTRVGRIGVHGGHPPQPGDRVLDIGCGFGDTTQRLAALVGPTGAAVGVDVAQPFVDASIAEARTAGARMSASSPATCR